MCGTAPKCPDTPGATHKCTDLSSNFECMRLEKCDPDKAFGMVNDTEKIKSSKKYKKETVNDIFDVFNDNLITPSAGNTLVINTDLSPCKSPLHVCCVAKE